MKAFAMMILAMAAFSGEPTATTTTTMTFDPQVVDTQRSAPQGQVVSAVARQKPPSLVKERTNFNDAILASVEGL